MTRQFRFLPFAASIITLLAMTTTAHADEALDRIFATGQLKTVEIGQTLTYNYSRLSPNPETRHSIQDGEIVLRIDPPGQRDKAPVIVATIEDGNQKRTLHPFPGDAGNPLVMMFLESVAGSMAKVAGGSPFYIRNRIKDAFRQGTNLIPLDIDLDGESVQAFQAVYEPFLNDPNSERMGVFKELSLAFVLSDDIDGKIVSLRANAGNDASGYRESMELDLQEAGK